ncbi:MAG: methylenetetrahydrofolate reductase [NAD(P)H] [Planctomycetia bacterium]|nr:methylenetetrahydrofolate reductase [NAD(P)H] [Planctomycetia bacterium]
MNLRHAYGPGKFGLSFELYPPKSETAEAELFEHVAELMTFRPDYVTCTYGAGGSTRSKTLDIVERVRRDFRGATASHLTCVGATVEQLRDYLTEAEKRGVSNIVALRGDPPKGETEFRQVVGGLRYANELVALIRAEFPNFGIAVAGYPEKHLEAPSLDVDLANLKRKVDSGADAVVTQLFYRNSDFFEFRNRCERLGIRIPLVPGILPVTNLAQIKRITALCGAQLPEDFRADLERCGADAEAQFEIGVAFAVRQVRELVAAGVPGIHFYVLNKSNATGRVLREVALAR